MSEFIKKFVGDRRVRAAAGFMTLGLSTAACAVQVNAGDSVLSTCGGAAKFDQVGSNQPVKSINALKSQAIAEVTTLHSRTLASNNEIDLPGGESLLATNNSLEIDYPGEHGGIDLITYTFHGNNVPIQAGAIACLQNSAIYPKVAFTSLHKFVDETESLSK